MPLLAPALAQHAAVHHITFLQAIVIGAIQGVTELFPVSSLGHSVLVPHWIGGSWATLVGKPSDKKSPYLAFIVVLHVATALALVIYFWRDWLLIIKGLGTSIVKRKAETVHERMAWLLILATIPAGIIGLALSHKLQSIFAKPEDAAIFLTINGFILFAGEYLRRRQLDAAVTSADAPPPPAGTDHSDLALDAAVISNVTPVTAAVIGVAQAGALLAGISRSGITMVAGLLRGLDHEQAVRFSFLLATPIILLAGVVKIPEILGHEGDGIRGQTLAGAGAAFVGALLATAFLTRYFRSNKLTPFAIYCVVAGVASIIRFA